MTRLPRRGPVPQPATGARLRRLALGLLACATLLGGCASLQEPPIGAASAARAERLMQDNPAGAAQMYERLAASSSGADRVRHTLAATRAWLAAARPDDAARTLRSLGTALTPAQQFERSLLDVEVLVGSGQNQAAWREAGAIAEPTGAVEADRLLRLRQQVGLRAGQPVAAVQAGIARDRAAGSEAERARVRRELLADLRAAIDRGQRINPADTTDPLVRGWLEIGQVAAEAGHSPLGAAAAIDRWRARYPGHPASTIAADQILVPGSAAAARGRASGPIALLLPLSGRQATAAALVRDGFEAGLAQLAQGMRPALRLYDTGAQPLSAALQSALADGAGFIAGPLTREEVQGATELYSGAVPLLLLNNTATALTARGIYQYALSPEDEARQVARRALAQGQRRAIAFASTGDWGNRVLAAFSDELVRGGGSVIAQSGYSNSSIDFTSMITRTLGVEQSEARKARLQQVIGGELVFEARRRNDVDLVFVAGQQPLVLRQILPQLRFLGAGDLPVYITAEGLDSDAAGNRDLEGALVADMPWALDESGPVAEVRASTQPLWASRGLRSSRLFAFGYDAAALALALGNYQSPGWPLAGLTGRLTVTPEGRVERDLDWVRIREGVARRLDDAP